MTNTTYVQDYNAIIAVLNLYNEGGKQAKSELMKPAFSDQATIFGVDGDGKLNWSPQIEGNPPIKREPGNFWRRLQRNIGVSAVETFL